MAMPIGQQPIEARALCGTASVAAQPRGAAHGQPETPRLRSPARPLVETVLEGELLHDGRGSGEGPPPWWSRGARLHAGPGAVDGPRRATIGADSAQRAYAETLGGGPVTGRLVDLMA